MVVQGNTIFLFIVRDNECKVLGCMVSLNSIMLLNIDKESGSLPK